MFNWLKKKPKDTALCGECRKTLDLCPACIAKGWKKAHVLSGPVLAQGGHGGSCTQDQWEEWKKQGYIK